MRVVIAGAGPAGLISALYLIQEGIRPLVLDKRSQHDTKACGEACDWESLAKLPFDSKPYIRTRLKGAKIIFGNSLFCHLDKDSVVLDRTSWLSGIAETVMAKGGDVRFNSKIIEVNDSFVRLENKQNIKYDVLVGADGPKSMTGRFVGVKHESLVASQYKISIHSSGIDYLEFYLDKRFSPMYSWIFPKGETANIGVVGKFSQLDEFISYMGIERTSILARQSGTIPVSGVGSQTAGWEH
jgi:flavin-dependent dehydrogenase